MHGEQLREKGQIFGSLPGQMQKTVSAAKENETLEPLAKKVDNAVTKLGEVSMGLGKTAEFYIRTVLPVIQGRLDSISEGCGAAIETEDTGLGGV
ncbi:MAG: hypothetical protein ACQETG_06860 [Thermodesulfobacteriota bacterium]